MHDLQQKFVGVRWCIQIYQLTVSKLARYYLLALTILPQPVGILLQVWWIWSRSKILSKIEEQAMAFVTIQQKSMEDMMIQLYEIGSSAAASGRSGSGDDTEVTPARRSHGEQ